MLKQCGDDLSRENIMSQAANLKDFELPMLLPGMKINTSPDNYLPDPADAACDVQRRELGVVRRVDTGLGTSPTPDPSPRRGGGELSPHIPAKSGEGNFRLVSPRLRAGELPPPLPALAGRGLGWGSLPPALRLRFASVRRRSAFSLMKPAASLWS